MTFGKKLKALREKAGMTQAALADASGVPVGTIRDYEQVKRDPLLPTAIKLAEALGVSVEEFSACSWDRAGKSEVSPSLGRPPKAAPAPPPAGDLQEQAAEPKGPLKGLGKGKGGGEALGGGLPAEKPGRKGRGKGK